MSNLYVKSPSGAYKSVIDTYLKNHDGTYDKKKLKLAYVKTEDGWKHKCQFDYDNPVITFTGNCRSDKLGYYVCPCGKESDSYAFGYNPEVHVGSLERTYTIRNSANEPVDYWGGEIPPCVCTHMNATVTYSEVWDCCGADTVIDIDVTDNFSEEHTMNWIYHDSSNEDEGYCSECGWYNEIISAHDCSRYEVIRDKIEYQDEYQHRVIHESCGACKNPIESTEILLVDHTLDITKSFDYIDGYDKGICSVCNNDCQVQHDCNRYPLGDWMYTGSEDIRCCSQCGIDMIHSPHDCNRFPRIEHGSWSECSVCGAPIDYDQ